MAMPDTAALHKVLALPSSSNSQALAQLRCEQPAAVREDLLDKWHCRLLRDSCLDQGRILLHTGQKTPGHPNYTRDGLFEPKNPVVDVTLPGYPEPLGTAHYRPVAKFALDIRAPTFLDPPDVWRPASFSNCTVPLIFQPHYFSIYAEFFLRRLTAISDMSGEGVFDRNVTFAPDTNGMVAISNRSSSAQGGLRQIVNLAELLERCRQWRPPEQSRFKAVECFSLEDSTPGTFIHDIARLQTVHAFVSLHGSGLANGLFLPAGSAVVEVLCWNFAGTWPDSYYKQSFEHDQSVKSGYFRLVADKDHCFPGEYEKRGIGSTVAYNRDKHIRIEFESLAQALIKIALGQVESTAQNSRDRVFYMLRDEKKEAKERDEKKGEKDSSPKPS
ncbi:hypothetical protein N2152v2_005605 [Parachlorella kessleri]